MKSKVEISATIVLYNENVKDLEKTINSLLKSSIKKHLFLIDNSPKSTSILKDLKEDGITYMKNKKNIGFGAAHNLILDKINSEYHLVLNPDVEFDARILIDLIKKLEQNKNLSMVSPEVIYPNGNLQYTCRKNPTIKQLISRKTGLFKNYFLNSHYLDKDLSKPFHPEFIHGCFMLFRTQDFIKLKGFDERYFLYMEDADICRKIYQSKKKILYYPEVQITHIHRTESAKKANLFIQHISSAIKYFRKWGFS